MSVQEHDIWIEIEMGVPFLKRNEDDDEKNFGRDILAALQSTDAGHPTPLRQSPFQNAVPPGQSPNWDVWAIAEDDSIAGHPVLKCHFLPPLIHSTRLQFSGLLIICA